MGPTVFQRRRMTLQMTVKNIKNLQEGPILRINLTLRGDLAHFAAELRRNGNVRNVPDLVCQGLRALQKEVTERELAKARLDSIKSSRIDPELDP
jgi:hypothetical protein